MTRFRGILPYLLMAVAFGLRVLWMSDMEFKGDEAEFLDHVVRFPTLPWTPLGLIAEHSGVVQSAGFYTFLSAISLRSHDPVTVALAIAIANAVAISLGLWILRRDERGLLTFAMCATSFNLVLQSRKIWTPDLMPVWTCLSLALLMAAGDATRSIRARQGLLFFSALSVMLAGHMYIPGLAYGGLLCASVAIAYLARRQFAELSAWVAGGVIGVATWIPYLSKVLTHSEGTFAKDAKALAVAENHLKFVDVYSTIKSAIRLASPYESLKMYLLGVRGQLIESSPDGAWLVHSTTALLSFAVAIFVALLVFALLRLRKRSVFSDVTTIGALTVVVGTGVAVLVLKLGTHLHYWLGAIPFAYYLIAMIATHTESSSRVRTWLRRAIWAGCLLSMIGTLLFLATVHRFGGLPGAYGKAYSQIAPILR